jgi:hypothetical protein
MNVTKLKDGTDVNVRVDNATQYRPWDPDQNGYLGFMYQTNLRPVFDYTGQEQPFKIDALAKLVITNLDLQDVIDMVDLDAQYSNSVSLFYQFFRFDNGLPVTLEETMIGFFDFDQSIGDDDKGLVRESMLITDFAAVLLTEDRHREHGALDWTFDSDIVKAKGLDISDPRYQLLTPPNCVDDPSCVGNGLIPVASFVKWPATESRYDALARPRGIPNDVEWKNTPGYHYNQDWNTNPPICNPSKSAAYLQMPPGD